MADDFGKLLQGSADAWQSELRRSLADRVPAAALGAGAAVLKQLDRAGLSQTELTARMGLSKQAVQQLLDQLEAGGLIRRESDLADRRAKRVVPTDTGLQAAATRQSAETLLEETLRERLGKKRFKAFRKALRELAG